MSEFLNVDVDLSTLERAVSPKTYDTGTGYARERAVRAIIWNPEDGLMRGTVRVGGRDYLATATLVVSGGLPARFAGSQCSCGVLGGCSHIVALAHAASSPEATRPTTTEPRPIPA